MCILSQIPKELFIFFNKQGRAIVIFSSTHGTEGVGSYRVLGDRQGAPQDWEQQDLLTPSCLGCGLLSASLTGCPSVSAWLSGRFHRMALMALDGSMAQNGPVALGSEAW